MPMASRKAIVTPSPKRWSACSGGRLRVISFFKGKMAAEGLKLRRKPVSFEASTKRPALRQVRRKAEAVIHDFRQARKHCRCSRRPVQLQLATEAEVWSCHIAIAATGRARPSCGLVLRLVGVPGVPRAVQDSTLTAAGFSRPFPTLALDAAEMAQVQQAMGRTIRHHAPYPGLILDRLRRIVALTDIAELVPQCV